MVRASSPEGAAVGPERHLGEQQGLDRQVGGAREQQGVHHVEHPAGGPEHDARVLDAAGPLEPALEQVPRLGRHVEDPAEPGGREQPLKQTPARAGEAGEDARDQGADAPGDGLPRGQAREGVARLPIALPT